MIVLSPVIVIPIDLERQFVVIEHDLPGRSQLLDIAGGIANEPGEMPKDGDLDRLLDAAAGLSRYEAEGAYSLSIVRCGKLQPQAIW